MAIKGGTQKGAQRECMLELGGGMSCYGQIVNLTLDNALVSTNAFAMSGRRTPKVGATGVITVNVKTRDKQETLKISCRVAYINAGQVGVNILSSALTNYQQELLKEITQTGTG
jgi:hypothetical protein